MDNRISVTNVAYQSDQDTDQDLLQKNDQITEFISPTFEEINKNQNILENFLSIDECPDDVKRVTMPDEKVEDRKRNNGNYLFNVKRAEPNHYEEC